MHQSPAEPGSIDAGIGARHGGSDPRSDGAAIGC
jgi:hypothetical protein